jgi:hypothetical protein
MQNCIRTVFVSLSFLALFTGMTYAQELQAEVTDSTKPAITGSGFDNHYEGPSRRTADFIETLSILPAAPPSNNFALQFDGVSLGKSIIGFWSSSHCNEIS